MSKEEEAISNLKRYIEEDLIYKENKPKSDFDEFCINHCRDIETVLYYIKKLEEDEKIDIDSIKEYEEYFINQSSSSEDVKDLARRYNILVKAIKQLNKKIKE